MKKVITYGTFDLLHQGHLNILKRSKDLGDYLIVGVTSENYDKERGKLNVRNGLIQRIEDVKATGLVDEIIIEEYQGQKIDDIQRYEVDVFAIGSDWLDKFDYLKEYCEVIYLDRTKGVSSTELRQEKNKIIDIGMIGSGRIAHRFIPESKFVSGVNVSGVYNPKLVSAQSFADTHQLGFCTNQLDDLFSRVQAVYIASPHMTHYNYIKQALEAGVHVLCEKPMVLAYAEAKELYALARKNNLVLIEAIKTAYAPGFNKLIFTVKSGAIGTIKDVEASFTKLSSIKDRELDAAQSGGSVTELVSYPLLAIFKLFGQNFSDLQFYSFFNDKIDLFTKGVLQFEKGIASFKVGLGVKTDGSLIISGTKGYAYVPAPWWKTEYFELRFEDQNKNQKHFYKFDGDGLRYEINEFAHLIHNPSKKNHCLTEKESLAMAKVIETFLQDCSKTIKLS